MNISSLAKPIHSETKLGFPVERVEATNAKTPQKSGAESEHIKTGARIINVSAQTQKNLAHLQSNIEKIIDKNALLQSENKIPPTVMNALTKLGSHIAPLSVDGNILQLISQLKLHTEKNASKDLKTILLILKNFFNDKETIPTFTHFKNLKYIKNTVSDLLANVDNQQTSASEKTIHSEIAQIFIYEFALEEMKRNVRLKAYYPKKKHGNSKEGFRLSLLLAMDKIGDIRTDFFFIEKNLNITFFVINNEVKKIIDSNLKQIKTILDKTVDCLILNVNVSPKKIMNFAAEDLNAENNKIVNLMA